MPFPGVVHLSTLFTHGLDVTFMHTTAELSSEERNVGRVAEQVGETAGFEIDQLDGDSLTFLQPHAGQPENARWPHRNRLGDRTIEALNTYSLNDTISGDEHGQIYDFGPLHETHTLWGQSQITSLLGAPAKTTIAVHTNAADDQNQAINFLTAKKFKEIANAPVVVVKMDEYGRQVAHRFESVPALETAVASRVNEVEHERFRYAQISNTRRVVDRAEEIIKDSEEKFLAIEGEQEAVRAQLATLADTVKAIEGRISNARRIVGRQMDA